MEGEEEGPVKGRYCSTPGPPPLIGKVDHSGFTSRPAGRLGSTCIMEVVSGLSTPSARHAYLTPILHPRPIMYPRLAGLAYNRTSFHGHHEYVVI